MGVVHFPIVRASSGSVEALGYDSFYEQSHSAIATGKRVNYIHIDNTGSGYSSPPDVSINGGTYSVRATGYVILAGDGVGQVIMTDYGTYSVAPTSVSFSGGGGGGAVGTLNVGTVSLVPTNDANAVTAGHTDTISYAGHIYVYLWRGVMEFNTTLLNASNLSGAKVVGPIGDDWFYMYPPVSGIKLVGASSVNDPLIVSDYVNLKNEQLIMGTAMGIIRNEIILNEDGLSNINVGGITRFGFRIQDEIDAIEPYHSGYADWEQVLSFMTYEEPELFAFDVLSNITSSSFSMSGHLSDLVYPCLRIENDEVSNYSNVSFRFVWRELVYPDDGIWTYGDWINNAPYDQTYSKDFTGLKPETAYAISVELSYNGLTYVQWEQVVFTNPPPRVAGIKSVHMDNVKNFQDFPNNQISWFGTAWPPQPTGCEE